MFVNQLISKLNKELKRKLLSGFIKEEYFTTWDYNYQSEVHSRVQALIIGVCNKMGFDIETERGFNYKEGRDTVRFKPDITLYKNNKVFGFIEYESTNSSDDRFYDLSAPTSDLRCLKMYVPSDHEVPPYWIIISTLPKRLVKKENWFSYCFSKSDAKFKKLIKSPFKYYFPRYISKTKKIIKDKRIKTKVFLLNIDSNKVKLEFKI
jgi:hypothetical protein